MDAQEFRQSQANISGSFGGLGMEISEQDQIPKVISPIDGTPAARAGIEPGDEIVLINHSTTQGMNLSKVVSLLRGDPGTTVMDALRDHLCFFGRNCFRSADH